MDRPVRPIANDPSAETVSLALMDRSWVLMSPGDYSAFAGEAMRFDGTNYDQLVFVELPGRVNKTDVEVMVRFAMSPEDALGLAKTMIHAAGWILESNAAKPNYPKLP